MTSESDRWKFLYQVFTTNRNKTHFTPCGGFDSYPSWSLSKTGDQKNPQYMDQGINNNEEYAKMPFKTISWSPRIPAKYCSKLYVLRVTSALLYSWRMPGAWRRWRVTQVHLSEERCLKRQEWGRKAFTNRRGRICYGKLIYLISSLTLYN